MSCVHGSKITATSRAASEDRVAPEVREALVVEASVPVEVPAEVGLEDPAL